MRSGHAIDVAIAFFYGFSALPQNPMARKKNVRNSLVDTRKIGRKGGKTRAARLTPRQRAESARKAANARWAREKGRPPQP